MCIRYIKDCRLPPIKYCCLLKTMVQVILVQLLVKLATTSFCESVLFWLLNYSCTCLLHVCCCLSFLQNFSKLQCHDMNVYIKESNKKQGSHTKSIWSSQRLPIESHVASPAGSAQPGMDPRLSGQCIHPAILASLSGSPGLSSAPLSVPVVIITHA